MISVLFSGSYVIEGEKESSVSRKKREEKYGPVLWLTQNPELAETVGLELD
jgi:hypothetical protein